jgi:hypothetical protein
MIEVLSFRKADKHDIQQQQLKAFHQNVRRANIAAASAESDYSSKTRTHRFIGNAAMNLDSAHGEVVASSAKKKANGKTSHVRAVVGEHSTPVLTATLDRPGKKPLERKFKGPIALGAANAIAERVTEGAIISGQKHRQRIENSRHQQTARRLHAVA